MSATAALTGGEAAGAGEAKAGKGGKRGKKRLLLLAAPMLLALIGAGLWFSGVLPGLLGHGHDAPHGAAHEEPAAAPPTYVELPEVVANLNGNPRRPSYIKIKPKIELAKPDDAARVQAAMPRVLDLFQTYLRETRPEELRGSAGTHRLREELIARANIAVAPARVVDILFTQMLVQ